MLTSFRVGEQKAQEAKRIATAEGSQLLQTPYKHLTNTYEHFTNTYKQLTNNSIILSYFFQDAGYKIRHLEW